MLSCKPTITPALLPHNIIKITTKPATISSRKMTSFFRPHHHLYQSAPEPNFQGLFRLIDDFDKYATQGVGNARQGSRNVVPSFTPKFDMRETETAYELHGELPGIAKEDLHIEFTDPQTLQVRGKVERVRTEGSPTAGLLTGNEDTEMTGAITEHGDDGVVVDHPETTSHKATVEDDPEESGSTVSGSSSNSTPKDTPATTVAETAKPQDQKAQQPAAPKHKYYLVERNIGQFSRSFSFPARVDNDSVRASLDNGILTVVVQKAKKHESRRIAIN